MNLKQTFLMTCLLASTALAQVKAPDSEHTLWVKIETVPSVAEIYALPSGNDPPSIRLGTTPCTIAIDLSWKTSWFKKRWDRINVFSPGSICHAAQQADRSYDLMLRFVAVKSGCKDKKVELRVATLNEPGPDWEGKSLWPTAAGVSVTLSPVAQSGAQEDPKTQAVRTVLFAGGNAGGESGTLNISANVDGAKVLVDDQIVGNTPLQVVVPEGRHTVQVKKAGYQPMRKQVQVEADAVVVVKAVLSP